MASEFQGLVREMIIKPQTDACVEQSHEFMKSDELNGPMAWRDLHWFRCSRLETQRPFTSSYASHVKPTISPVRECPYICQALQERLAM